MAKNGHGWQIKRHGINQNCRISLEIPIDIILYTVNDDKSALLKIGIRHQIRRNPVHSSTWISACFNIWYDVLSYAIQWNSSGKARNVSLKLQNLVHFHAPFFTNHVYFTPHDRPPLLKGHHLEWGDPETPEFSWIRNLISFYTTVQPWRVINVEV